MTTKRQAEAVAEAYQCGFDHGSARIRRIQMHPLLDGVERESRTVFPGDSWTLTTRDEFDDGGLTVIRKHVIRLDFTE